MHVHNTVGPNENYFGSPDPGKRLLWIDTPAELDVFVLSYVVASYST